MTACTIEVQTRAGLCDVALQLCRHSGAGGRAGRRFRTMSVLDPVGDDRTEVRLRVDEKKSETRVVLVVAVCGLQIGSSEQGGLTCREVQALLSVRVFFVIVCCVLVLFVGHPVSCVDYIYTSGRN